jgi:hypothetical protein
VAWSPDGTRLASASDDSTIRLWDAVAGSPFATLQGHSDSVNAVAWSPDGRRLASASDDNSIRLWDVSADSPRWLCVFESNQAIGIAWTPAGFCRISGEDLSMLSLAVPRPDRSGTVLHLPFVGLRSIFEKPERVRAALAGDLAPRPGDPELVEWDGKRETLSFLSQWPGGAVSPPAAAPAPRPSVPEIQPAAGRKVPLGSTVPRPLAEAYAAGKVIAFIGSGASLSRGVLGDFPTWGKIGDRLLDACRRQSLADERWISSMSEVFKAGLSLKEMLSQLGTIRVKLAREYRAVLLEIFRPRGAQPGPLHRLICSMAFRAILTTNYDELLEISSAELARRRYTWRQATAALQDLQAGDRILLKVHGSAEDEESVVLTAAEYERLSQDKSYAAVLRFLLQDSTFLFIGYGMNDPLDLDRALASHAQDFHSAARRHYVLLHQADDATRDRLLEQFNVQVIRYEDHEDLLPFLEGLSRSGF